MHQVRLNLYMLLFVRHGLN